MKKLLLGTLAWAAMAGAVPAFAAEMPVRPAAAAAVSNWNGFYVGINAGGGFQSQEATLSGTDTLCFPGIGCAGILGAFGIPNLASSMGVPMWVTGPLGGFTLGWNWQAGWWLAGIEADIDCANITGVTDLTAGGAGTVFIPRTISVTNTLDRLGTVRGRLGWIAGNNFLIYGTGGFAYGRNTLELAANGAFGPPLNAYNQVRDTKTGWTAGGGIEWNFISNWTVKGEYLFVDLGNQSTTVVFSPPGIFTTATVENRDRYHILRFGVNYIFGSLGKSVIAAY